MNVVLHQSGAKLAIDCLARFKVERLDGIDTSGIWAQVGTAVHAAIEAGYRGSATGNREPLDCALDGLGEWWAAQTGVALKVKVEAETMLRTAYGPDSNIWLRLPGRGQSVQAEYRWAMDAEFAAVPVGDERAAYEGIIDYVEWGPKGVTLADHKTIRRMVSNVELAEDIQGWLYCLWGLSQFAAPSVTWKMNLIRHGYSARTKFKRGDPWETRAKRLFTDVRLAVIRAHETGEWPATPGDGCDWCPIRHKCPELGALVAMGSVPEDASPETVARMHLALTPVAAQAKRLAEKFAENAPIPVGIGKVLGFKPVVNKEWTVSIPERLSHLRHSGASEEDLARWFPAKGTHSTLSKSGMSAALTELAIRGEIEDPVKELDALFEAIPGVRFCAHVEE